jgi:Right handed beta helix region
MKNVGRDALLAPAAGRPVTLPAVAQPPASPAPAWRGRYGRSARRLAGSVAFALGALSACGGSAMAGPTLYVDKDSVGGGCSDGRPAAQVTATAPWCSLERARDAAPAGSTVLVRRGDYPGLVVDGETRAEFVSFKAQAGEVPAIAGIEVRRSSRFRFEGFHITDNNLIHDGTQHVQFVGNEIRDGTRAVGNVGGILFERNHVHDVALNTGNPAASVGLWAGGEPAPNGITVRHNRFQRLPNDALFLSASNLLVENNEFLNIQSPDNDIAHADVLQCMGCNNLVYRGNYARDNDSGLLNSVADSENWVIENNMFLRSDSWPLQLDNENRDLILRNNTFWDSGVGVLFRWDPAFTANPSGFVIANNIFDRLSIDSRLNIAVEDYNLIAGGQSSPGAHDLVRVQPRFVDVAAGDLRLAPGSPGIDAGTAAHAPADDIFGGARPVDDPAVPNTGDGAGAFDIGAHERLSVPTRAPGPGTFDIGAHERLSTPGGLPGAGAPGLLRLRVPARQRLRRGRLIAYATCARRCRIGARARVTVRRRTSGSSAAQKRARRVRSRVVTGRLRAGRTTRLVLRFKPRGRRVLRRALRHRRTLSGVVRVRARAGGTRGSGSRRVRVRR